MDWKRTGKKPSGRRPAGGAGHGRKTSTTGSGPRRVPVLAAGSGWLVVEKPAGMSVHNEPGRDLVSVASAMIREDSDLGERVSTEPGFGVHPVHRLDRETSGVLLLAVSKEMFRYFSAEFESRRVVKRYVALVHGRLENPEEEGAWGAWDRPLANGAAGRSDPAGSGPLLESLTRYRATEHSAHYTRVEIELASGRTHQIRRHAKLSGHPVVGDERYGSTRAIQFLRQNHGFDRLALHARALTLRLPGGKEPFTVETPEIPEAMRELFEKDRASGEA